ncbi:MAG: Serine/threonine protein kinase [Armatimonadetes bacterium]|nr:Serine/threonine protein kinase [Armatimonadota bacterium]
MAANTLGRYHIIREIARSNDIVYEAMDPAQGKRIALKELQIPGNLVGEGRRERIERFTREARSAHGLKHTNIVRILDHGQAQGRYFIAMEFLEGQSLRDVIRQRGAMPLQEALRIAACVADGLDYAHKHGVIHRDIKPDNVHLEPDGRVVITDFGIARITFEASLTADGQIFGTPSYMSPEQVTGKGIDKRSDIFSLGVMLYEMVAGRKPFTGDSVITITYNIMNVEPAPMVGAPHGVEQIIRKAISKDPNRRYRSAAEFAEDLQLVSKGGSPRHASAASIPASRGAGPSQPSRSTTPSPAVRQPPQNQGARPMPRPVFGASPGSVAPNQNQRPPQGARPMPPAPWGGTPGPGARPNGAPPATSWGSPGGAPPANGYSPASPNGYLPQGANGYPPQPPNGYPAPAANGYPPPGAMPNAPQAYPARGRAARSESGSEFKWILPWLAVAIVIAGIVLTVVWASVKAYDQFRSDTASVASTKVQQSAEEAFRQGRFEEALDGYLQALKEVKGAQQEVIRGNAARAAAEVAQLNVKAGKGPEAEKFARQALELNANSAKAYIAFGQALSLQGNVDGAAKAFDDATAVVVRVQQGTGSAADRSEAKDASDKIPLWKADVLYKDGLNQMNKNPQLAQLRFQAVMAAAPGSTYAKNAKIYLGQLQSGAAGMGGPAGLGGPAGDLGAPGAVGVDPAMTTPMDPSAPSTPSTPPGWNSSYRQGFPAGPATSGGAGTGGTLPPPLGRF